MTSTPAPETKVSVRSLTDTLFKALDEYRHATMELYTLLPGLYGNRVLADQDKKSLLANIPTSFTDDAVAVIHALGARIRNARCLIATPRSLSTADAEKFMDKFIADEHTAVEKRAAENSPRVRVSTAILAASKTSSMAIKMYAPAVRTALTQLQVVLTALPKLLAHSKFGSVKTLIECGDTKEATKVKAALTATQDGLYNMLLNIIAVDKADEQPKRFVVPDLPIAAKKKGQKV